MLIKKHDKSDIVELEDGSLWRIWPGDVALTLNWLPTTDLLISEIGDEFCSHALIDQTDGSRVRVIEANEDWPVDRGLPVRAPGPPRSPPSTLGLGVGPVKRKTQRILFQFRHRKFLDVSLETKLAAK
jgi:hypothetical protein